MYAVILREGFLLEYTQHLAIYFRNSLVNVMSYPEMYTKFNAYDYLYTYSYNHFQGLLATTILTFQPGSWFTHGLTFPGHGPKPTMSQGRLGVACSAVARQSASLPTCKPSSMSNVEVRSV